MGLVEPRNGYDKRLGNVCSYVGRLFGMMLPEYLLLREVNVKRIHIMSCVCVLLVLLVISIILCV